MVCIEFKFWSDFSDQDYVTLFGSFLRPLHSRMPQRSCCGMRVCFADILKASVCSEPFPLLLILSFVALFHKLYHILMKQLNPKGLEQIIE